jgi:hypothetical protein
LKVVLTACQGDNYVMGFIRVGHLVALSLSCLYLVCLRPLKSPIYISIYILFVLLSLQYNVSQLLIILRGYGPLAISNHTLLTLTKLCLPLAQLHSPRSTASSTTPTNMDVASGSRR